MIYLLLILNSNFKVKKSPYIRLQTVNKVKFESSLLLWKNVIMRNDKDVNDQKEVIQVK